MSLSSPSNSPMEVNRDGEPKPEPLTSPDTTNNMSNNNFVVKGKRTKRQRTHQTLLGPMGPTMGSSSTSSSEFSGSTTEEEEDMANCLILLAQGRALDTSVPKPVGERPSSRRFTEAATTTNGKAGFYVYECKTCNKCFPSFQALGGHRASHRKPKNPPTTAVVPEEDEIHISPLSLLPSGLNHNGSNKARVHECAICGTEFSSGQALGGHMRRHRSMTVVASPPEAKKEKNLLSLDLNLPAPFEDDHEDKEDYPKPAPSTAFSFARNQSHELLFSASALVDCHY